MKILFGKLGHETNTFSSERGDFKRWAPNGWLVGEKIRTELHGKTDYPSGMMRAAEEYGVELIPTVSLLDAGPLLTREAVDFAVGTLLDYVEKYKKEIDGICLGLHGAGCAEGLDDLEGYTLRRVRGIVGSEMPITVSLDLHANISDEMVLLANGLFGVKQYPHVDAEQAGYLAMKSLIQQLRGEVTLRTAYVHLPLLIAPAAGCTFEMPMKRLADHVADYAKAHGLIDASLFHGFPYTDRPYAGASIVVVSDTDPTAAARELARYLWDNRHALDSKTLSAKEAVDQALETLGKPGKGYVVINETSDNPGGGAPCDGTWLLRELIERDVPRSILGYIHDAETALQAHAAGVGATIKIRLGGKTDHLHGVPIEAEHAVVCALSDGKAVFNAPMYKDMPIDFGKSARLRIGNVEVVVTEILATQTLCNAPFLMVGADINHYGIVCVKSSNHFKAYFSERAKAIVTADPPGIHTSNFSQLPFAHIARPVYPLDPDTVFEI